MVLKPPCSNYDSLLLVGRSAVLHDTTHYDFVGILQKLTGNSLEMVYNVSSSRREADDDEVFDLDD
jgi:hypothetical protein